MSRADEIQEAFRNTYLYVDVDEIFPDLKPDLTSLQSLLESLPRIETMFWCCRASMTLAGLGDESPFDRQRELVSTRLVQEDIDLLNRMQHAAGTGEAVHALQPRSDAGTLSMGYAVL